jgi:hypothetical protein
MVGAVDGAFAFHELILCLLSKHVKNYFEFSTEIFEMPIDKCLLDAYCNEQGE